MLAAAGLRKWLTKRGDTAPVSPETPSSPLTPKGEGKEEVPQAAEPAVHWRSFRDEPRIINSLLPAPRQGIDDLAKYICKNK
jgi:hypothetical protein